MHGKKFCNECAEKAHALQKVAIGIKFDSNSHVSSLETQNHVLERRVHVLERRVHVLERRVHVLTK